MKCGLFECDEDSAWFSGEFVELERMFVTPKSAFVPNLF